ncbi:hypothetical protein ACH4U7_49355 [Streptomyces sp. NPDC020845]|uniref:hypothetical protein n=1 Tax=Streptomyces sp. NPDC020845 TaxID=3365096 RepID=UPI0037B6D99D
MNWWDAVTSNLPSSPSRAIAARVSPGGRPTVATVPSAFHSTTPWPDCTPTTWPSSAMSVARRLALGVEVVRTGRPSSDEDADRLIKNREAPLPRP